MNEKGFNSQICTTIEQSKRLLDLGLKPETADMVMLKELTYDEKRHCLCDADTYMIRPIDYLDGERHRGHIHAWSLHRLIEIRFAADDIGLGVYNIHNRNFVSCYEILISVIEYLIKIGEFNKEYLQL